MNHQPKLIYLARHAPGLSRTGFTARWREHAALGMSRPRWRNVARYVHVDLEPGCGFDAIGMIWHRSSEHRAAHLADTTSRAEMEADEAVTFARPIAESCLAAREEVLVAPSDGATWLMVAFLDHLHPELTVANHCGHIRNFPLAPERATGWGLMSAQIDEFSFARRADAVAAAKALEAPGVMLVVGRAVELYRR